MNKPLSALAGIALLGAAGATGVIVAPLGGEEEVVSQEQETATPTTEDLREGWVRFEHPGTAETPPFSFAHPSEWYLKRTPVPVTLPTGESLGTGVRVDAFNRNPDASPSHPLGPGEVRLEVYVGPWDLYTNCPPDRGLITPLGNGPGERSITPGNPPEIMGSVAVYEITETLCYEAVGYWWSDVPVEDTFDLIRESFRVGQTLISSNDGASPSPPSNEAPTASDARPAFPSEPTPPYSCIYMVVDAQVVCEPMNGYNFPDGCSPIMWQDRAACLPPNAQLSSAIVDGPVGPSPRPCAGGFQQIARGYSIIKWGTELCDFYVAPEDEVDFRGLRELFLLGGATPPPAPFQYNCRYIVIDGELLCLSMDNPAVRACRPVDYRGRSGCAPPGTQFSAEAADYFDPVRGEMIYKSYALITRGNSRIKYGPMDEEPGYFIAPEDAVDFAALEAVFHPN